MRGLKIIVLTADAERFRGALTVAAAHAAMGGEAALFLQLDAVSLLLAPRMAPRDEAHRDAGLPPLAALMDDALALGVGMLVCQSGLDLAGLTADQLGSGILASGPVAFLQQVKEDDRLMLV